MWLIGSIEEMDMPHIVRLHYPWSFVDIFIEVEVKHKQVANKKLYLKATIVDREKEMADGEENE